MTLEQNFAALARAVVCLPHTDVEVGLVRDMQIDTFLDLSALIGHAVLVYVSTNAKLNKK